MHVNNSTNIATYITYYILAPFSHEHASQLTIDAHHSHRYGITFPGGPSS